MDDWRKIGIGLTAAGLFFMVVGVLLFFDKALLAMGNLLFLAGVVFVIGPTKTSQFFFQKRKLRGTAFFLGGITIVLFGWPVVGMLVEFFGFLNLFGDFFPVVLVFLRNFPVIGPFFRHPTVRKFTDRVVNEDQRLPV